MRSDEKQSRAKVAKEAILNPLASQRDIAQATGLSLGNVNDKLNKLEQIGGKDDRIIGITDKDLSILTIGQREIERRLNDKDEVEKMRTVEISQVIKESTARYSLFRGSATDNEGGLKETVTIEI